MIQARRSIDECVATQNGKGHGLDRWASDGISYELRKESRFIQAEFWIRGRRIRRSTRQTDRKEAEATGRRLRVEAEDRLAHGPPVSDRYLFLETWAEIDTRRAKSSARNAKSPKGCHFNLGPDPQPPGAGMPARGHHRADLRRYREQRKATKGVRNQTIVREWRALKRAFVMALERPDVQANREVADHIRTMLAVWPKIGKPDPKDPTKAGTLADRGGDPSRM